MIEYLKHFIFGILGKRYGRYKYIATVTSTNIQWVWYVGMTGKQFEVEPYEGDWRTVEPIALVGDNKGIFKNEDVSIEKEMVSITTKLGKWSSTLPVK